MSQNFRVFLKQHAFHNLGIIKPHAQNHVKPCSKSYKETHALSSSTHAKSRNLRINRAL